MRGRMPAILLGALCLALAAARLGSESLTLTTSYPSPAGIYKSLVTTSQTLLARDGGRVGIGTTAPQAALDVASADSGLLPPRLTQAQRDAIAAPPQGSVIYNTQARSIQFYDGSAWVGLSSPAAGGFQTGSFAANAPHAQALGFRPKAVTVYCDHDHPVVKLESMPASVVHANHHFYDDEPGGYNDNYWMRLGPAGFTVGGSHLHSGPSEPCHFIAFR